MKAKAFELRVDVQKIAPFSRVAKCQIYSKSHLFQEPEKAEEWRSKLPPDEDVGGWRRTEDGIQNSEFRS